MDTEIESGDGPYSATASPVKSTGNSLIQESPSEGASVLKLVAISMPRMAINMAWSANYAAFSPYLSTMLPNYAVQLTQLIGPVVGIIVGPMVGTLSDRNTSRFGRRRPFLVIGAILTIVCWTLLSFTKELGVALGDSGEKNRKWTGGLTVFFYFWMDIMISSCQTPAMLITADFAGRRQTLGSSIGLAWAAFGSLFVALYIQIFGAAYLTLHYFIGMLCCIMALSVLVCCIAANETPLDKSAVTKSGSAILQGLTAVIDIFKGLKTLPKDLVSYALIMFFVLYGYAAYNGNKGQFFGLEVYGGVSTGASSCDDTCTDEQNAFNAGVKLASGTGDLLFCVVGYLYALSLPFLVRLIGAKWVLSLSLLPQVLLLAMAFCKNKAFDIFLVAMLSCSFNSVFGLMVPVIIHVFGGKPDINIGMYVGSLNAANSLGSLVNYAVGSALVQTSLGYKLPVLVGGCMSLLGLSVAIFFVKIKMYSM
jgi:solute carrier family 45 protein 1/2/4